MSLIKYYVVKLYLFMIKKPWGHGAKPPSYGAKPLGAKPPWG